MKLRLLLLAAACLWLSGAQVLALDLPSSPIDTQSKACLAAYAVQSGETTRDQGQPGIGQSPAPVPSGRLLRVTRADLVTFSGWLRERTENSLRLRELDGSLVTVENENILRIEQKHGRKTFVGAVIGTGLGFATAALRAALHRSDRLTPAGQNENNEFPSEVFAIYPVIGAIAGGSVGTLFPNYREVQFENLPMTGVERALLTE